MAVCPHCGLPVTGTTAGLRGRAALRRQRRAMEQCRLRGHLPNADCVCLRCGARVHAFDGCTCRNCGLRRDDGHRWQGCRCAVCGQVSPQEFHVFESCSCKHCGAPLLEDAAHDWVYEGFGDCDESCGLRAPANDQEVFLPPRDVCVYHGGSCPHRSRYRCARCGTVKTEGHLPGAPVQTEDL